MVNAQANAKVKAFIDEIVKSGEEAGLQVAAYLDGELVIDCWSGHADRSTGRMVDGETLFTTASMAKGVTATCVHVLADRGKLDYEAPIAKYWPEFAQQGKGKATVRHGLTHSVGIPHTPKDMTPERLCDWEWMTTQLAAMAPIWEPGTKSGYHGMTQGWILGEVVRRVSGKTVGQFLQDEICKPLGGIDVYLGIPDAVEPRCAKLEAATGPITGFVAPAGAAAPAAPAAQGLYRNPHPPGFGIDVWNRPDVRRAMIPAAGGIMSARGIGKLYACLGNGGKLGNTRLISTETMWKAITWQTDEDVINGPVVMPSKAMGYFLGFDANSAVPADRGFGVGGAGGYTGFAIPQYKFSMGFMKTLRRNGGIDGKAPSAVRTSAAVREALEIRIRG